jgi:hypothetical protein
MKQKIFLLIILFFIHFQIAFGQFDVYPSYEKDSNDFMKIDRLINPHPIDSNMEKIIIDFAKKKSLEYKIFICRKVLNFDSLFPDTFSRKKFETNPYILDYPQYRDYKYAPLWRVQSMNGGEVFSGKYLRNMFEVIRYDRFIRSADILKGISADTIQSNEEWVSFDGIYGENDFIYSIYYCPPTGHLRVIGGNALLEQLPDGAYTDDEDYANLIGRVRAVQYLYQINKYTNWTLAFWRGQDSDTIGTFTRKDRKYYYYLVYRLPYHDFKLLAVPVAHREIIDEQRASDSDIVIRKVIQKNEEWNNIEIIWFRRPNYGFWNTWKGYKKGFKMYEMHRIFNNLPQSFEEKYTHVRGLTQPEIDLIYRQNIMKNKMLSSFIDN